MSSYEGMLGLACRARKVVSGDTLFKAILSNDVYLVIIAEDCGNNSRKKLVNKCDFYKVPYVFVEDSLKLNQAIGGYNVKAVGLKDEGFARKLHTCLKG
ncbi:MAG: ribosomal L7Ae/L30e/S12e/Gadd45 family protein [Erysipelotrichaceae bacterium]